MPRSPALAVREHRLPSAESIRTWLSLRAVALHLECVALGASRVTKDLNPYVEARREWNDRYLDLVRARRWWQITAVAELALVGVLASGLVALSLQHKTIPYVVEVDALGAATAVKPVEAAGRPTDERIVRYQLAVAAAATRCPSLDKRWISPHTLRHTTAMHLLQSGVDLSVIALWLGHESPETTHLYIEADLAMKERALAKLQDPPSKAFRFRASDRLLAFLDGL